MKHFDTMCYGLEEPTIEELLADEIIDFEDYAGEMYEDEQYEKWCAEQAEKYDAQFAYEGGYCE